MTEPTLAHSFFDEIKHSDDPFAFLSGLVNTTPPTFEEEWLEFKRADDARSNVQQTWSKALSGFANTGGGVLIWGIEAKRKPETDRDCASGMFLIDDPPALKSRLMQLHQQATDPPVLGVVVEPYMDSAGKGFVVCLIPESSHKPHRAEQDGKKQFYLRAGDDFVIMPVPVLRSMFHPIVRPNLRIQCSISHPTESTTISYRFRIHNTGTATAREMLVYVRSNSVPLDSLKHSGFCSNWGNHLVLGQAILCGQPLHPGASLDLCRVDDRATERLLFPGSTKRFAFQIYASDHEPQAAEVIFGERDFLYGEPKWAAPIEVVRSSE